MRVCVVEAIIADDEQHGDASFEVAPSSSFDEFFFAHHASIVRALALTLGDAELGRDAASEGFCRALQRWSRVRRYDNAAGWVYRVGLNWATSRRRKTRREQPGPVPERSEPPPPLSDDHLVDALATLSVDHRCVLIARFYLGWSEKEIAHALGIAPGTVKSRSARALAELAQRLRRSSMEDER